MKSYRKTCAPLWIWSIFIAVCLLAVGCGVSYETQKSTVNSGEADVPALGAPDIDPTAGEADCVYLSQEACEMREDCLGAYADVACPPCPEGLDCPPCTSTPSFVGCEEVTYDAEAPEESGRECWVDDDCEAGEVCWLGGEDDGFACMCPACEEPDAECEPCDCEQEPRREQGVCLHPGVGEPTPEEGECATDSDCPGGYCEIFSTCPGEDCPPPQPSECVYAHCDDDSPVVCNALPPTCVEGEIVAVREGCYACVDPQTCEAEADECWGAWSDVDGNCRAPNDGSYPAHCCDESDPVDVDPPPPQGTDAAVLTMKNTCGPDGGSGLQLVWSLEPSEEICVVPEGSFVRIDFFSAPQIAGVWELGETDRLGPPGPSVEVCEGGVCEQAVGTLEIEEIIVGEVSHGHLRVTHGTWEAETQFVAYQCFENDSDFCF